LETLKQYADNTPASPSTTIDFVYLKYARMTQECNFNCPFYHTRLHH